MLMLFLNEMMIIDFHYKRTFGECNKSNVTFCNSCNLNQLYIFIKIFIYINFVIIISIVVWEADNPYIVLTNEVNLLGVSV